MATIDRRGLKVDGSSPSSSDTPDVALAIKLAVRVASSADLTLAGLQTVDGVALVEGHRVLAKNQTDATQNGIYVVSSGNWTRSVDFDASAEIASGVIVMASAGTIGAQTMYQLTTADPIVLGTSNLTWAVVSGEMGPQGIQGPQGETGDPGPQGDEGTPGISGTSAVTRIRVIDTAGLDPNSAYENGDTVNGVVLATNDLVLRAKTVADAANGVYVVPASGAASRHSDFATYDSLPGTLFSVMEGTVKADTLWQCTSDRGGTIGVTAIAVEEFSGGGGIPAAPLYGFINAVDDFGAVGDGVADDTVPLQNAIVAAEMYGAIVVFGKHRITAPLQVSDRVGLLGFGYQSDEGSGYGGVGFIPTPVASVKGSCLLPSSAFSAININTRKAVKLEKFQISYLANAATNGFAAIAGTTPSGFNTHSIFRDLLITRADVGIKLTNFLEYNIDHVLALYNWNGAIVVENPNGPSWGDSIIQGCTFWGGAVTQSFHVLVKSSGALRIHNNWFQAGGANISNGILIQPNTVAPGSQQFEPIIITGNTFEGQTIGINFNKPAGVVADASQFVISGNQFWAGLHCIYAVGSPDGDPIWIRSGTISANSFCISNGVAGRPLLRLDGMRDVAVSGNSFASVNGLGTAVWKGANTVNIRLSGCVASSGVVLVEP